jgi:DNA-binding NarL/FixJ family response regulator
MYSFHDAALPACDATDSSETPGSGSIYGSEQTPSGNEEPPDHSRKVVVIIEPRTLSREGMSHLLASRCDKFRLVAVAEVAEVLHSESAASLCDAVILLSLGSRDISDHRVRGDIAELSRLIPGVSVIVVCEREESHQVREALRQGVRGYIPTTMTARVLVEAVRLVQAGGTFVPAGAFVNAGRPAKRLEGVSDMAFSLSSLTPRQRQVLDLLRRGKPNKIIAHELSMCEGTVKVHVRQIMRKLNATNRTQAAFLAAGVVGQDA